MQISLDFLPELRRLEGFRVYGRRVLDWLDQTNPAGFRDIFPKPEGRGIIPRDAKDYLLRYNLLPEEYQISKLRKGLRALRAKLKRKPGPYVMEGYSEEGWTNFGEK